MSSLKRIFYHVAEYQNGWETVGQSLTYTFNTQAYRSTNKTVFNFVLCPWMPSSTFQAIEDVIPANVYRETYFHILLVKWRNYFQNSRTEVEVGYKFFHKWQKRKYDQHVVVLPR